MKDLPILFQGDMVLGVLDDTKTQTRRVAKGFYDNSLGDEETTELSNGEIVDTLSLCPYGKPGDRLWVRENLRKSKSGRLDNFYYSADDKGVGNDVWARYVDIGWTDKKSIPSIHMHRWASRINLLNEDVRVQRVQDISEQDAVAEGVRREWDGSYPWYKNYSGIGPANFKCDAKESYRTLWDSINAKPKPIYKRDINKKKFISHYVSYPWENGTRALIHRGKPWYVYGNPRVWAVTFKRLLKC